jgi:homoserine kinase
MPNTRAEAFAPATVANMGVGFDILGFAVAGSGDTIIAEWNKDGEVKIIEITGDNGKLSYDPTKNVVSISTMALLKQVGENRGVNLWIKKGLPLSSGLGSSAASAVGGAVAVNALMGEPLSREELLPASLEGEAAVSGYHADNVAPCLFGGITLTNGVEAHKIKRLPVPSNFFLAFVTPDVEVPTAQARAVLPKEVSLKTMIHQTGAVAELMDAIYRGDIKAMAQAMEADRVVEPARAHLMPYLTEIRDVAKTNGALSLVISGAGPTLCAVCDDEKIAQRVANAMREHYEERELASISRYGKVLTDGAQVMVLGSRQSS